MTKKPGIFNRICAYPVIISWVLGASVLDAALLTFPPNGVPLTAIASDWLGTIFLILAIIATTFLGFFLGMFTCWPLVRIVCSRFNGAPLKVGDRVIVLSGKHKGAIAEVYEITVGQGGWELARLDLGQQYMNKFTDIFEEYSLLKMKLG